MGCALLAADDERASGRRGVAAELMMPHQKAPSEERPPCASIANCMASLLCFLVVLASLTTATALRNPLRRRFNNIPQKAAITPEDERVLAEAATPAGRAKLADVRKVLSDKSFISSVTSALPSFGGEATAEELAEIASRARAALPDDTWLARARCRTPSHSLAATIPDGLAARLAETSEWRSRIIPDASDESWEFANFFRGQQGQDVCE